MHMPQSPSHSSHSDGSMILAGHNEHVARSDAAANSLDSLSASTAACGASEAAASLDLLATCMATCGASEAAAAVAARISSMGKMLTGDAVLFVRHIGQLFSPRLVHDAMQ